MMSDSYFLFTIKNGGFLETSELDFYSKIYTILGKDNFYFHSKSMITISERTPPISSYKNIVKHPLTKEIFADTMSQLGIQDSVKKDLIKEFTAIVNGFEDFSYTGDIEHFKVNLYTTLSETKKDINLLDILSTEEFVAKSTKAIGNHISILPRDTKEHVSLDEYLRIFRKREERISSILSVLRGLYSRSDNHETLHRDTAEVIAALKKHFIVNSKDDSTSALTALVEKSKQNEADMIAENSHFDILKSYAYADAYTYSLSGPDDYAKIIDRVKTALNYFTDCDSDKKKKLDGIMHDFFENMIRRSLSRYQRRYGYLGPDIFSIELKQGMSMDDLKNLLHDFLGYKNDVIKIMNDRITQEQKEITKCEESINTFDRPTWDERCKNAPFRGAPIKSDQAYQRELNGYKLDLDMYTKNLDLMKSYLLAMT